MHVSSCSGSIAADQQVSKPLSGPTFFDSWQVPLPICPKDGAARLWESIADQQLSCMFHLAVEVLLLTSRYQNRFMGQQVVMHV